MRRYALIVVLLVLGASACWAQEQVLLRYQFRPGDSYNYALKASGGGEMIIVNLQDNTRQVTPMKFDLQMTLGLKVDAVDAEGNGKLIWTVGPMTLTGEVAGQKMKAEFDLSQGTATVDGQPQQLPPEMVAMLGRGLRMTMNPQGQVVAIEGMEQLEQMMQMSGMSGLNFKEMLRQTGPQLPAQPVKLGDSWVQQFDLGAPATTIARYAVHYILTGLDPTQQRATMAINGRFVMPAQPPAKLDMGLMKMSMTMLGLREDVTGNMIFDYGRGVLAGGDFQITLNTRMMMEGAMALGGKNDSMAIGMQMHNLKLAISLELQPPPG